MGFQDLLSALGDEVADPEEESFLLFSQTLPSQNLGFVDPKAFSLDLTIAGKDVTIHQSPTILSSNRAEGTTGAVVWKISPLFADWIGSAQNFLFQQKILDCSSTVLELGCGISGIVALALGPLVGRYIATDQDYALKLLKQNIAENSPKPSEPHRRTLSRDPKIREKATDTHLSAAVEKVKIMALDWELDSLDTLPEILRAGVRHVDICLSQGVDAVIACDCIYNEALIEPFVRTCVDICRLRQAESEARLTMCIIAQQLRSSEIFETWLIAFHKAFHVWRISDHLLTGSLKQDSGFIVHIGTLRI